MCPQHLSNPHNKERSFLQQGSIRFTMKVCTPVGPTQGEFNASQIDVPRWSTRVS